MYTYINGYRTGLKEDMEELERGGSERERSVIFLEHYDKLDKEEQVIYEILLAFLDEHNMNITSDYILKTYDRYYTPDEHKTEEEVQQLRVEIVNKLREIELD